MELTNTTFTRAMEALSDTHIDWKLPKAKLNVWHKTLAVAISDEFFPKVILDWMINVPAPPKMAAEIIKHSREMVIKEYGSADTAAEILIDSARSAYTISRDFMDFADEYNNSFASAIRPAEEAYILNKIKERSKSSNILIFVFDEIKGGLKDCFSGDEEHGIEFIRTHIKKKWQTVANDAANEFLKSGEIKINQNPRLQSHQQRKLLTAHTDSTTNLED